MPQTSLKFRKATPKDVKGIFEVMKNVGYITYFYGGKSESEVIPMILENFFSKNKPNTIVIGEIDSSGGKRIIAYSIFGSYLYYKKKEFPEEKENYAYSRGTGVHSEFQGKGFGTILKDITVEIAKREGYKGMYTDVASNNTASLKVQKKTGFTMVAEVQDKSRPKGIHSIVFKKTF